MEITKEEAKIIKEVMELTAPNKAMFCNKEECNCFDSLLHNIHKFIGED